MGNGPLKKVYPFSFWIGSETDLLGPKRLNNSQYKVLQSKFNRGFSHRIAWSCGCGHGRTRSELPSILNITRFYYPKYVTGQIRSKSSNFFSQPQESSQW